MMTKYFRRGLFLIFFGWLFATGTTVLADPVDVGNPSFESPVLQQGGYIIGSFDSWDAIATAGVFYPAPFQFNLPLPDGNQIGIANDSAGQLSQTLSATLLSNTIYTLTVYVGRRLDCCNPSSYSVELYAGGVLIGSDNSQDPAPGDFALSTVIYTSGDPDPLEGLPLQIVLNSTGPVGQIAFDSVALDATPVGANGDRF